MDSNDPVYRLIDEKFSALSEKISDMKSDIIASIAKVEQRQFSTDNRVTKISQIFDQKLDVLERDLRTKTREVHVEMRAELDKMEEKIDKTYALKHELYPIRLAVFGGIGALGLSVIGLLVRLISVQAHP